MRSGPRRHIAQPLSAFQRDRAGRQRHDKADDTEQREFFHTAAGHSSFKRCHQAINPVELQSSPMPQRNLSTTSTEGVWFVGSK